MKSSKCDLAATKDETSADKLAEIWDCKSSEWKERQKSMAEELQAIHEMIKLLNDDGALEIFKATLTSLSLVQVIQTSD